ncbi:MAG: mandelate racemase/muconate lactonizing enzyme family protein [Bryobacteraceae bacterium]|nr:mandelate racemase/muconate lactonizing enzyme family protein [Bryobacteraceae bacterium]
MRIARIEAFPVRLARDRSAAQGTAGSPTALESGERPYRWSTTVPTVYSDRFETTLVRVTLTNGLVGWGESQAPVAPRVPAVIIEDLLGPLLAGEAFDGSRGAIEHLWEQMFQSMRVRGQTGGFMMDAIAGIDLALWDLAGKIQGQPVARLIRADAPVLVPAYLSGLAGPDPVEFARGYCAQGFRLAKLFFDRSEAELLEVIDRLRDELPELGFAVDCLWRLRWPESREFLDELARRNPRWVEAPFQPDDREAHEAVFARYPIALGESYRTRAEMGWFAPRVQVLQPDLGRAGITETLRMAEFGVPIVPHVSIAMGPQIAAAIHVSAALGARYCEFNPAVLAMANRFSDPSIAMETAAYRVPEAPGLGLEISSAAASDIR